MKKIIFVIDSLNIGGAERSLITLLSHLDYNKFDVDLQLFQYNGKLEPLLTKRVNKLKPLYLTEYLNSSLKNQIKNPKLFFKRMIYSFLIRLNPRSANDIARIYWQHLGNCIKSNEKNYDIAIAYGQRIPTYYIIDKVKAKNKICWVNIDHRPTGKNLEFERRYYKETNHIITVSSSVYNLMTNKIFPEYREKTRIIKDPIDREYILKLSNEPILLNFNPKSFVVLLTVARLNKDQKGLDIALETAIRLKEYNLNFKWLIIGDGEYRNQLKKDIIKARLEDSFILLGELKNPYPYFNICDIYVQTSRHEGYGIAIEEAKIFNRPIVITNFNTAKLLIKNNINGIISSFNPVDIANDIIKITKDHRFQEEIINFLKTEKKDNLKPVEEFENLIM